MKSWKQDTALTKSVPFHYYHYYYRQPWAQCPLVSDAILTIAAHRCLSRAAWLNSCRVVPHHCDFRLRDILRANCTLQIDQDKLHMKFSALNVDFNSPSLDLLCSRKPAHEGIKEQYPLKVIIWPLLASLLWKWLQIAMDMLPITTSLVMSFLIVSTSITLNDSDLQK